MAADDAGDTQKAQSDGDAAAEAARDAALLARAAAGDQAAAAVIVAEQSGRVLAIAQRLLGPGAEAEDALQEAMLKVWRVAPDWRAGEARLSTWLHRVTVNLCYDRLRKRKREVQPPEDAPEPVDPSPNAAEAMEVEQTSAALHAAIAALPERQAEAVRMRHFEEMANPEIAAALGVSVEAVESLLSRGRRALRQALASRREDFT